MQIHHVGFRIRGFYRLAQFRPRGDMIPHEAQHRFTILQFWARHGLVATREAFGVSRRTLYRWQRTLTQAGGEPHALAARSRAPHRRRQARWPPALSQEIRRLRTTYPNLGKAKLHVLLQPWCTQQGRPLPSVLHHRAPDRPGSRPHAPSPAPPRCPRPPQARRPAPQDPAAPAAPHPTAGPVRL